MTKSKQQQPAEQPLTREQCAAAVKGIERAMRAVGRHDITAREASSWLAAQHAESSGKPAKEDSDESE